MAESASDKELFYLEQMEDEFGNYRGKLRIPGERLKSPCFN